MAGVDLVPLVDEGLGNSAYLVDLGDDPDWAEKQMGVDADPKTTTSRLAPQEVKQLKLGGPADKK